MWIDDLLAVLIYMFYKFERFCFVYSDAIADGKGWPCNVRLSELSCHSEGTLPGKTNPGSKSPLNLSMF